MKPLRTLVLAGQVLYRVVRAGWSDPLEATWSQTARDRRWNTIDFPALYCCLSLDVARAITRDLLGLAGVELDDLQPAYRPRLVEIGWSGELVDVATAPGVAAAGFPGSYPEGVHRSDTRRAALRWYRQEREGVACRSASLHRLGLAKWTGAPERWSEAALFVDHCRTPPVRLGHHDDGGWLQPVRSPTA
ncbi:MAG TPA: RES domain-containing protein [Thermoanaerobaculia bacterium]|jgi:RES domain-containing protein|nr:RES domain-containing protein [Thermoanaerobaculia bacterium]